ncbi:piRNA biogenesis protein EXD1 isoform X2 [Heterocephalus glaber]|uniref:piRNA biogenesis protein EXD1 n=1 Tax=Heterocephalus glaber TaxID=10181 RepID=A0AAX6RLS7_HETGA|nr:piRNA biogenesis protein EXD1 isoform X2 [Heterocephalus glaber]
MDPSNDYHFLNQILWRRVKLTLVSGVFEVKNVETGQNVPGVKIFFGHEIVNVEPLDEVEQGSVREKTSSVSKDSLNTEGTRMEKMKGENLKVCEPTSPALKAPIAPLLNDLKNSPSEEKEVTYTVIDQFQQKFGAAMLHIKKQSVLSVAAEGPNVCRHGKLYWLQVATNSRVYLFDIFLLGSRAFSNGLQMILEDKRILKVIHDCRWLSDCLSHQYGIMLNNVFDTQVADVFQFSMETGGFLPNCISTLQQSLIRHLNVAPKYLSFLEDRQKLTQENPEVWFTRPLPPSLLKMLALEVTYLLPLRTALLDEMMSDLTTLVGGYLKPCREGSADQLAGAQPTCMELPEELLQLKDFQKQRRERAVKEYRMNARGLLIRTMLHPKQSETATAGKEEKVRGFLFSKDSREDKLPSLTSHEFHEDGNFSKGKFQTIVKSQHLPPIHKGEASEGSSNKLICLESKGSQDVKVTQTEHFMLAKHEFQSSFSLKEEREQLLILEDEEYLLSTKPDVSVPPFLPQESRVSPNDTFHPFKEAGTSTLPPCPALEKTGSWISPSLNLPEGLQFA